MKPAIRSYADPTTKLRTNGEGLGSPAQPTSSERMKSVDVPSKLERNYPAMASAIGLLWGHPEMNEYFDKLWLADGRAEPIDPEVMADLMLLARVHQDLEPSRPKATVSSIYGTAYGDRPARQDVWGYAQRMR